MVGNRECAQIVRTQRMTKDVDILEMHHRKNIYVSYDNDSTKSTIFSNQLRELILISAEIETNICRTKCSEDYCDATTLDENLCRILTS